MARPRPLPPWRWPPGPPGLLKFFEYGCPPLHRHTRPGVGDAEAQPAVRQAGNAQPGPACCGKLHRVAGQVDQHLAQPLGIAAEPAGHIRVYARGNFQAFGLGARRYQLDDTLDQLREIKIILRQFQPPRLDLGEIQDFVDQRRQRPARRFDRVDIGYLLGVQRRVAQQVRHAQYAIQRGAEFVTDSRQKTRLGLAGGLGPLARRRCLAQLPDFILQFFGQSGGPRCAKAAAARQPQAQPGEHKRGPAQKRGKLMRNK